jgi:hypothetical protein
MTWSSPTSQLRRSATSWTMRSRFDVGKASSRPVTAGCPTTRSRSRVRSKRPRLRSGPSYHDQAGNAPRRFGGATARLGTAARAQAVVHMAVDAKTGWKLAEAAVHRDAAGPPRQYHRSQYLGRLHHRFSFSGGADRAR